jgi:hypothetical protein
MNDLTVADRQFLDVVRTYVKSSPAVAAYVAEAASAGVLDAFNAQSEKCADLEVALHYSLTGHKTGRKYLNDFGHVVRLLEKWKGRTSFRWDDVIVSLRKRLENVQIKLTVAAIAEAVKSTDGERT